MRLIIIYIIISKPIGKCFLVINYFTEDFCCTSFNETSPSKIITRTAWNKRYRNVLVSYAIYYFMQCTIPANNNDTIGFWVNLFCDFPSMTGIFCIIINAFYFLIKFALLYFRKNSFCLTMSCYRINNKNKHYKPAPMIG